MCHVRCVGDTLVAHPFIPLNGRCLLAVDNGDRWRIRPGGLLCVSHRPRFYYLLEAARRGDLETAQQVLAGCEGYLEGPGRGYYNWQTEDELRQLYRDLGLRWITVYPIDHVAWLAQVNPSQLSREQQEAWLQLELQSADGAAMCGRYALVVAAKPSRPL